MRLSKSKSSDRATRTSRGRQLNILSTKSAAVKAQVVAAGIPFGVLAKAAGLSAPSLSQYLAGTIRNERRRRDIYIAFRSLSGSTVSFEEFWGDMLSERIAG